MLKIQAKNDRDAAAEELKVTTQKADALLSAAKTNAEKEKQAILLAARESAKATMDNADQWAKSRKAALLDDVKDEMVDIALAASAKLMASKADSESDRKAVEAFVKEMGEHE